MFANLLKPMTVPAAAEALPGRDTPILAPRPMLFSAIPSSRPFPKALLN